jgi:6,7-dimethyl-8-ribityllumazine synthase
MKRIAFVQACWHKEIVDQCRTSFTAEIAGRGLTKATSISSKFRKHPAKAVAG